MKLLAVLSVVILAGCGSIANTVFDSEEAQRYVNVMVQSNRMLKRCAEPTATAASMTADALELRDTTEDAEEYSRIKFNNPRIAEAGKILLEQVDQLNTRYTTSAPSTGYCQLKLAQISAAAELVARSIGKKEVVSPIALP